MLEQPNFSQNPSANLGSFDASQDPQHSETILTILWRFKWLLGAFVAIGTSIGYWVYKQKPTMYRATSQLLFKTDTPLTLDSSTGMIRGGMPSGTLMQSLITSDEIVRNAAKDLQQKSIPSLNGVEELKLVGMVRQGIRFQAITDAQDSRDRMIAALNFDGRDPEVCVAAVTAVSNSISLHFANERQTTLNQIQELISEADEKVVKRQNELEEKYHLFRETSNLQWNAENEAINPYRERQFQLQSLRLEQEQKLRELNSDYRLASNASESYKDPLLVAQIIGRLGGVVNSFENSNSGGPKTDPGTSDLTLQKYEVEKSLIPLQIKLEQLELEFGSSHPEVKSITMRLETSEKKLNELNELIAQRMTELKADDQQAVAGEEFRKYRTEQARIAVEAYMKSLHERITILTEDVNALDKQIDEQRALADDLKEKEETEASYKRQIESIKGLRHQLEQKLSAIDLADVSGGIIVDPLMETGRAYVTGPDLKKDLLLFGMAGLALSGLMALMFEFSAKMFRSAEEVQRELRLPVLTHIPMDEGRVQPTKGMMAPEIARLDPKLSVVHRPYSPAAEAIRGVRTAMLFDRREFKSKVFQITSPLPGDGKSTLAANIGCSIAQSGKKTLLIDLDLRSPRLSLRFDLEAKSGLTNVLNGEMGPAEAVHQTPIENLDILPCGPLPANPAEALTLAELGDVFQWARENYDFVIVDTPPLLMVSDPAVVTTYVDVAMLVIRIRRRCKPNAKEAIAMLRSAGARVMGVVVNEIDEVSGGASYKSSASGSYQSIGYGYGDKYRRRYQQEANSQDTYVVKGHQATDRLNLADGGDSVEPEMANPTGAPVRPRVSQPRPRARS